MDTKEPPSRISKGDVKRARLKIVAWITLYLIATHQKSKIIEIFKEKEIFLKHAKYIAAWKQDKANQAYEKRIEKEILSEVDRFLKERKKSRK